MKGHQLIANTLEGYGITHVFFVPTILNATLVELERTTSIDRIVTHSEKAAAYMADGYARAANRPSVCMAQMVGSANLAAGLRDARLASSPVLALTGGPWSHSRDRFQYQEIDDRAMFQPVTKGSFRVEHAGRVASAMRRGFRLAMSGRPGPVHLEFPGHHGDVLEEQDCDEPIVVEEEYKSLPLHRVAADDRAVELAAGAIASSDRPLIIAGGGVRQSDSEARLVAFAERHRIPVATSLTGKSAIAAGHPLAVGVTGLYSRPSANRVAAAADLVIMLGTKAGSQVTAGWKVPQPGVRVIHVDVDPEVVGVNYPRTTPLIGDIAVVLDQLEAEPALHDWTSPDDWTRSAAAAVTAWYEATTELRATGTVPIRPERLCTELAQHLPGDAVVVADTGHAGMWSGGWLDLDSPGQTFLRSAGSLGWAMPAGLGAQCALPDRPVVVFTGDGGLWYHIAELETAARWRIPATIVVNNNHSFNQEINIWKAAYGGELTGRHEELWRFHQVDIATVAAAMGVPSIRVEDPDKVGAALEEGIGTPGPYLIEVITDTYAVAPQAVVPKPGEKL